MSSELKPCPFCGGEAEIERIGTGRQSCIATCTNCGCRHESGDSGERSGHSWNTRTPEKPKLPCVSPENLVEGEWYVFNYHQKFIPMFGKAELHQGKFRLVDSFHSSKWAWANSETEVYGPVLFDRSNDE